MTSTSPWKDKAIEIDGSKHLVYRLNPDVSHASPDDWPEPMREWFKTYCNGDQDYVKLNSNQCKLLCIEYPLYVSYQFLLNVTIGGGEYPWQRVRHPDYVNKILPEMSRQKGRDVKAEDLTWNEFTEVLGRSGRNDEDKLALRGGYTIPARNANAELNMYPLGDSVKAFYQPSAWDRVMKASMSLVEGWAQGATFRSVNPPDLNLVIQPYKRDLRDANMKVNGVSWNMVQEAFHRVVLTDDTVKTKYYFGFPNNDPSNFLLLSTNPFCHYETWISHEDFNKFFLPDWPMPPPEYVDDAMVTELKRLRELTEPSAKEIAAAQKLMYGGANVTWDTHTGYISLSAERIFRGAGKRKGTRQQGTVMGTSAPETARKSFKWDEALRTKPFHIAEWLHLSAFSFGGLAEGHESWHTSQMQLNMIFGTSETNSLMLRYEKAWQELFKLEYDLRVVRNKNDLNTEKEGDVVGALTYANNRDLNVHCNLVNPDNGQRYSGDIEFNGKVGWETCYGNCPWICFALEYRVEIYGWCRLLDWENPCFTTHFSPFARPFFTKGETLADTLLLKTIFHDKVAEQEAQIAQQQHGHHLTTGLQQSIHQSLIPAPVVIDKMELEDSVEGEFGEPIATESITTSFIEPLSDSRISKVANEDSENTDSTQPVETPMSMLEANLTSRPDFEHLDSVDNYMESIADQLEFRETVDGDLVIPSSSVTQAAGMMMAQETTALKAPFLSNPESSELEVANDIAAVKVGGIRIQNPSLVVYNNEGSIADLPITVHAVASSESNEGLLLTPLPTAPQLEKPILLLSAVTGSGIEVQGIPLNNTASIEKTVQRNFSENLTRTATLPAYAISGELHEDLFGVPGLRGKIVTMQNTDPDVPILEIIKPNFGELSGGPISQLFPFVDNPIVRKMPIDNLQFVYSEDQSDLLHHAGLRIEGDIKFTGALQPVADLLDILIGGGNNKPPTGLHVAAHLAEERDWKHMPLFSNFQLQGSLEDMSVSVGDWLTFTRVGVELSACQVGQAGTDLSHWTWGYGLFGSVDIHGIDGTHAVPLQADYRMKKFGDNYRLDMTLKSKAWDCVFGLKKLSLHGVRFQTAFTSKSFRESFSVGISAFLTFGKSDIYLEGGYSKEETFLEAEIGNLTWAEIVNAYHQILGEPVTEDARGDEIKFENLFIRISRKGITLAGKVTFNGKTSVEGLVSFDDFGVTVKGGIGNFVVADSDIEIKEAGFDVFVASKSHTGEARPNRFAIHGEVEFAGVRAKAHLHTSFLGQSKERQWFLFGSIEGDIRASDFSKALAGSDMDNSLVLRNAAILATNMDSTAQVGINPLKYPVTKGLSICALLDPVGSLNRLARGNVEGLMLTASIGLDGSPKLAICLPARLDVNLSDTAALSILNVAVEISKQPKLILDASLALKMKDQGPLILAIALQAGPLEAGAYVRTETLWKNPFGISDRVEIHQLAVELAFNYVAGPSKFGLAGDGHAGEIACGAAITVGQQPDQQLLAFNISKLDVGEIVRFVGQVVDVKALQDVEKGSFLSFTDAAMYFSTGATLAGKVYPAGISARGILEVFGQRAHFDATVSKSGIRFDGALDNFTVGPLVVKSATGGEQALLSMEMTSQKQELHIDGRIDFLTLQLSAVVTLSTKPLLMNINITVAFTQEFYFNLTAMVDNFSNYKNVGDKSPRFTAELKTDVLGFVCEGVISLLNRLQDDVNKDTDALEFSLRQRRMQLEDEKTQAQKNLDEVESLFAAARAKRDEIMAPELVKLEEARKSHEILKQALDDKKLAKENEVKAAEEILAAAQKERKLAFEAKKVEYSIKLEEAKREQVSHEGEVSRLRQQKSDTFGQALKKLLDAEEENNKKQRSVREARDAYYDAVRDFDRGNFLTKGPLSFKCAYRKTLLEAAEFGQRMSENTLKMVRGFMETPEFKDLDAAITKAIKDADAAKRAQEALEREGPDGYAREMLRDKDLEIDTKIAALEGVMAANSKYMAAIEEAQVQLDENEPRLLEIIRKADAAIILAQEDKELVRLRGEVQALKTRGEAMGRKIEEVEEGLEMVRNRVNIAIDTVKVLLEGISKVFFRITRVKVVADAGAIARGEAFEFVVAGKLAGIEKEVTVKWSPTQSPAALFKAIITAVF